MTIRLRSIGILVLLMLSLIGVGAALFIYTGVYNIAATKQNTKPVISYLSTQ
jgi:CHASE3 domain sensor protein